MKDVHVKVVQDKEEPIAEAILAESIKRIGDAVTRLDKAGLSERAIVLLVQHASGASKTATQNVLYGLRNLEKLYLKPKAKK